MSVAVSEYRTSVEDLIHWILYDLAEITANAQFGLKTAGVLQRLHKISDNLEHLRAWESRASDFVQDFARFLSRSRDSWIELRAQTKLHEASRREEVLKLLKENETTLVVRLEELHAQARLFRNLAINSSYLDKEVQQDYIDQLACIEGTDMKSLMKTWYYLF